MLGRFLDGCPHGRAVALVPNGAVLAERPARLDAPHGSPDLGGGFGIGGGALVVVAVYGGIVSIG